MGSAGIKYSRVISGVMLTKDEAAREVARLVSKCKSNATSLHSLTEEETKKDYILPLFKALNWETEDSKEVSAEENISKKRVDYGFRLDGIPKFYLEAKALDEDLDVNFAKQAVNYSWLKSTTWAVLTNFKILKVYNAEWKSLNVLDKMFFELSFEDLVPKFDKLWLLSKDSFQKSELDGVAEDWGKKLKRVPVTPVTEQLFVDMIDWRQKLTRDISKHRANMTLLKTDENLDESVQRILDRLIFIRVCEDRQIEPYSLLSRLREWKGSNRRKSFYHLMVDVCREFDEHYNSKLFSKHPSDDLEIDDFVMNKVIYELYENKQEGFPYDFAAIDADVLGSIYEQYLGYILEKRKKKAAVVGDSGRRKKMGIYYTPRWVVDYIVKNTVEQHFGNGSDSRGVSILDPACGSGSFLIGALSSLINHNHALTFEDSIDALRRGIHGVDIDSRAVEIAQLNLLLRLLERRKMLPELDKNIYVGNSLVQDTSIDDKAFDWKAGFPELGGSFDVVIGNPPYVESRDIDNEEWEYYRKTFASAYGKFDLSVLFIEKGILLLRDGGRLGFIISNKFAASDYGLGIRKFILENCAIEQIIDVSNVQVFRDASTYPWIIILRKESSERKRTTNRIKVMKVSSEPDIGTPRNIYEIEQAAFYSSPNLIFSVELTPQVKEIVDKVARNSSVLEKLCEMKDGIHTGNVRDKLIVHKKLDSNCKKMITAESINRYFVKWDGLWIRYDPNVIDPSKGEYGSLRNERIFIADEKLVTALFGLRPEVAYDNKKLYANNSVKIILPTKENVNLKFVLACLNSRLVAFYHKIFFAPTHVRGGYMQFYPQDFLRLPIAGANPNQLIPILKLVDRLIELNSKLDETAPESDAGNRLREQIERTNRELDSNIYDIYGLTKDEVQVLESFLA